MNAAETFISDAWARKTERGVSVYRDEQMTLLIQHWPPWRSDCPDQRQRYLHLFTPERLSFRLRWKA